MVQNSPLYCVYVKIKTSWIKNISKLFSIENTSSWYVIKIITEVAGKRIEQPSLKIMGIAAVVGKNYIWEAYLCHVSAISSSSDLNLKGACIKLR